jgi:hypothetical protein
MFAIPYRRVRLDSALSPLELSRRVEAVTQRRYRWFRLPRANIQFVGTVTENRLRLIPVVRGQNSYAPWVLATLQPTHRGSAVDIRMTLHPVAIVAVLGLFSVVEYGAIRGDGGQAFWPVVGLIAFHVLMYYYVGFIPEARRVESLIRHLASQGDASVAARYSVRSRT